MNALEIERLSKSYDDKSFALKDLTLILPEGEILGFLGPNGSGKTTAVRLLNGILKPTLGNAKILGRDIIKQSKELRALCGIMTETATSYESLTGWENLMFFGKLYNLKESTIKERSTILLKSLDLYEAKDRKVKTFSTGMKKRMSLARALLHSPKVLFLDEPTSGLDPEAVLNVTDMIKRLAKQQGVTVFLCTHQLKYAEEICSYYGFVQKGQLLGYGTLDELLRQKKQHMYLHIRGIDLPEVIGGKRLSLDTLQIPITNDEMAAEILNFMITRGSRIYEATQRRLSLEELYFEYVRGQRNE